MGSQDMGSQDAYDGRGVEVEIQQDANENDFMLVAHLLSKEVSQS